MVHIMWIESSRPGDNTVYWSMGWGKRANRDHTHGHFAESNKKQNSFPFDCFYCIPLGQDNLYELLSLNSSSEYFISSTIFFALTSLC